MFSAVIQYLSFVKENIFNSVLSLNPQLQLKEVLNWLWHVIMKYYLQIAYFTMI